MHIESSPQAPVTASLGQRLAHDADAVEVAAAVVAVWRDIDAALRPIIGQGGVLALFRRSVHLTAVLHPWLAVRKLEVAADFDFLAMEPLFSKQPAATALAAGNALLLAFHQLLGSLIGASLTERLLQSVWVLPIGDSPEQESAS